MPGQFVSHLTAFSSLYAPLYTYGSHCDGIPLHKDNDLSPVFHGSPSFLRSDCRSGATEEVNGLTCWKH